MSAEFEAKIVPRSSQEKVELQPDGTLKIWVRAAPTDGQANEAVCALLAKRLGLPKTSVAVVRGATSRKKRLSCEGIEPSVALERLS